MRPCLACGREFAGRNNDCPFCGFNNAPGGGPRSLRSLAEADQQRQEEFDRELADLTEEMGLCLGWDGADEANLQKEAKI
jgi:hypothetical protein